MGRLCYCASLMLMITSKRDIPSEAPPPRKRRCHLHQGDEHSAAPVAALRSDTACGLPVSACWAPTGHERVSITKMQGYQQHAVAGRGEDLRVVGAHARPVLPTSSVS